MFFSVSKCADKRFPNSQKLGRLFLCFDEGWHNTSVDNQTIWFKGYSDQHPLEDQISCNFATVKQGLPGNYCLIIYDFITDQISIRHSRYRSFPIYIHHDCVTNLVTSNNTIWSDQLINIDQNLHIETECRDILGNFSNSRVTREQAIDLIDQRLSQSIKQFVDSNRLPLKVYLSGGVDSALVYSYLQRFTENIELISCWHVDFDRFWMLNHRTIQNNYWAYNQIHHWREPCILSSGTPGDEFMLRSPTTVDLWIKHHGDHMLDLLPEYENSLHHAYFSKQKHIDIFQNQSWLNLDYEQTQKHISNIVINDWQHWHLGKTLTFTPLRDIEILKILLSMDYSDCLEQIFNSAISLELIERNYPGLSEVLSAKKNSGNVLENLVDFLRL